MIDLNSVRLLAHILLIGWAMAIVFLVIVARGRFIQVVHVPLAVCGLVFFILWLMGLVFSMKATGPLPREQIIPFLAAVEFGAGLCGWAWLAVSAKYSFRFALRSHKPASAGD